MAILGIDEVGRGPLAGPLVVGAVILPEVSAGDAGSDFGVGMPEWVGELRDSKKLTAKKRERLSEVILREAATGIGEVTAAELDRLGMTEALRLATRRAVLEVQKTRVPFSEIVIDGKMNFLSGTSLERFVTTVVKADDLIREVSAASIIAKVTRDGYMTELASEFSGYGFERNMGYGTKEHLSAIARSGLCPEHRRSFEPCKSMTGFSREEEARKNTTRLGLRGEEATVEYLVSAGHMIVARNFKTKLYEIDIISVFRGRIYFTEVKYRKNGDYGGGVSAVDRRKLAQMRFAAECFMKYQRRFTGLSPLLAVADVAGADFSVKDWIVLD